MAKPRAENLPRHARARAVADAAHAIVVARDFCGNEREAAREALAEHGLRAEPDVLAEAMGVANSTWRASQRAAGVKPIYYRY